MRRIAELLEEVEGWKKPPGPGTEGEQIEQAILMLTEAVIHVAMEVESLRLEMALKE